MIISYLRWTYFPHCYITYVIICLLGMVLLYELGVYFIALKILFTSPACYCSHKSECIFYHIGKWLIDLACEYNKAFSNCILYCTENCSQLILLKNCIVITCAWLLVLCLVWKSSFFAKFVCYKLFKNFSYSNLKKFFKICKLYTSKYSKKKKKTSKIF